MKLLGKLCTRATDMSSLFANSYALKTVGDLSHWNTSNVTNMSSMFEMDNLNSALSDAGDLGKWDTSNVTDMSLMFLMSRLVPGNICSCTVKKQATENNR